jgi:hypothetical protein
LIIIEKKGTKVKPKKIMYFGLKPLRTSYYITSHVSRSDWAVVILDSNFKVLGMRIFICVTETE